MQGGPERQLSLWLWAAEGGRSAGHVEEAPCWGKVRLDEPEWRWSFHRGALAELLPPPVEVGSQTEDWGHV